MGRTGGRTVRQKLTTLSPEAAQLLERLGSGTLNTAEAKECLKTFQILELNRCGTSENPISFPDNTSLRRLVVRGNIAPLIDLRNVETLTSIQLDKESLKTLLPEHVTLKQFFTLWEWEA